MKQVVLTVNTVVQRFKILCALLFNLINVVSLLFIIHFNSPLNAMSRTHIGTTLLQHLKQLIVVHVD